MTQAVSTMEMARMEMPEHSSGVLLRSAVICLTAFLTVVDLFATITSHRRQWALR